MTSRIDRLLIAFMFALLAAGATLIIASAQGEEPPAVQTAVQDCAACHTDSQANWEKGSHGQSGVVKCESCHGTPPADHPNTNMTVDRSPKLCISCHSNANFGTENWQASKHYQLGVDCATCHDPHATSLKQIAGPRDESNNVDDASALCVNCHKDQNAKASHSTHAQKGVACADCHVNPMENVDGSTSTAINHTFNASVVSCSNCHAEQMHGDGEAKLPEGHTASISAEETNPNNVSTEPQPIGAMGFSALAGIIGLAGGMVLAPWLERWFHRSVKEKNEDDHER